MRPRAIAVALISVVMVSGCGQGGGDSPSPDTVTPGEATGTPGAATDTLDIIRETGIARIGFANQTPYGYASPDGEITGVDPDVVREALTELNLESFEATIADFGALIPGLQAGRFDMIAAGLFVRPERCEEVLFTNPVLKSGTGLIVQSGNPLNLHSFEDVLSSGARVAVSPGTVEFDYLQQAGVPEDNVVSVPDAPTGIIAVQTDRADAFALTSLSAVTFVQEAEGEGIETAVPFASEVNGEPIQDFGAIAVRQTDQELANVINERLAEMHADGTLLEIMERHGLTENEVPPPDVTSAELCGE